MERLYAQDRSKGLILFRINTKESRETILQFLEKNPTQIPILLDNTVKVGRLFGVWVHPTSYLIDRRGMVRYRTMGVTDWANLECMSLIDQLLNEKP